MRRRRSPRNGTLTAGSAVANASFVAVAQVVGKLSTLVWTVVAAQQLGQYGFGTFNLALAVGLVLTAVGEWGFDRVLVRRASNHTGRSSRYFTEVVVWQLGIAIPIMLMGTLVFAVVTPNREAILAFVMVLLALLCDMVSDTGRASSSAVHRQGTTSLALIAQRLITAAVAIPAMLAWGTVLALGGAFLFSAVVGLVLHLLVLQRLGIRLVPRLVSSRGLRMALAGTGLIGLSALIGVILYRAGFIALGALDSEQAVGAYSAAFRLFETVLFLAFALVSAVFPLMSLQKTSDRIRELTEATVGVLAGLYLPFAVVCLLEAPRLIDLVFGDEYVAESSQSLQWFAFAPLLVAIAYVGGAALVAATKTVGLVVSAVAATAACLVLSPLLIPLYGATGAAIALTLALGIDALITTVYLRRALGRWPRYLSQFVPPALFSTLVLAALWLLEASFLVELVTSAILYVICWGAFMRWSRHSAANLLRGGSRELQRAEPPLTAPVETAPEAPASEGLNNDHVGEGVFAGRQAVSPQSTQTDRGQPGRSHHGDQVSSEGEGK